MYDLYYSPGACSLAVHIALREIGAPHRLQRISVLEGETTRPDYLAINPKGRVPLLAFDGTALTEVPAILTYLADAHPEAQLLPAAPLARARCAEWLAWLASEVHPAFGQIWRPERSIADPGQFAAVRARGMANVRARFDEIEARLSGASEYAAGSFSVVDPYLLVFHRWGTLIGQDMSAHGNWTRLSDRTSGRTAVQSATAAEEAGVSKQVPPTVG